MNALPIHNSYMHVQILSELCMHGAVEMCHVKCRKGCQIRLLCRSLQVGRDRMGGLASLFPVSCFSLLQVFIHCLQAMKRWWERLETRLKIPRVNILRVYTYIHGHAQVTLLNLLYARAHTTETDAGNVLSEPLKREKCSSRLTLVSAHNLLRFTSMRNVR